MVLSEYYDVKNKFFEHKSFNKGYLIEKYDRNGNKLAEKKLDFDDKLFADKVNFKFDENGKSNSNLFFHDCYEYNGKLYFVTEKVERSSLVDHKAGILVRMNSTAVYDFHDYFLLEVDNKLMDYNFTKIAKQPQIAYVNSYVRRPLLNMFEMKYNSSLSHMLSFFEGPNKFYFQFIEKDFKDEGVLFHLKRVENNQGILSTKELSRVVINEQELYRFRILPFDGYKNLIVKSFETLKMSLY